VQLENRKVSVIIPFYNRLDLLKRAVESLKNQTYKNWELILVDDCGSEKINFPTDEFVVIRNEKNSGPGFSRQAGLEWAKGEYVAFLDSDDYFAPEFISKSLAMHGSCDNKIAFTYCWSGVLEAPDDTWKTTDKAYSKIFPNLVFGRQWPTAALLWNRKYLSDWNSFYMWEDYDVELRSALSQNNIGYINEKLVFISRGELNGLSHQSMSLDKLKDQLKVLEFLWVHKLAYEELISNRSDSKIVWTQIAIRTLKNIKYQLEIDRQHGGKNQRELGNKMQGFELKLIFAISSFFVKMSKDLDVKWLKFCIHFYKKRLERLKSSSLQGHDLISPKG
jgi:glycosyltransferase involved in cell wall biosynthesis